MNNKSIDEMNDGELKDFLKGEFSIKECKAKPNIADVVSILPIPPVRMGRKMSDKDRVSKKKVAVREVILDALETRFKAEGIVKFANHTDKMVVLIDPDTRIAHITIPMCEIVWHTGDQLFDRVVAVAIKQLADAFADIDKESAKKPKRKKKEKTPTN